MPKYYRFRALTPTRKMKQRKDREKETDKVQVELLNKVEKKEKEDPTCMNSISFEYSPAFAWYLRRTAWRQPQVDLPRQLSTVLHGTNRLNLVLKIPNASFFLH